MIRTSKTLGAVVRLFALAGMLIVVIWPAVAQACHHFRPYVTRLNYVPGSHQHLVITLVSNDGYCDYEAEIRSNTQVLTKFTIVRLYSRAEKAPNLELALPKTVYKIKMSNSLIESSAVGQQVISYSWVTGDGPGQGASTLDIYTYLHGQSRRILRLSEGAGILNFSVDHGLLVVRGNENHGCMICNSPGEARLKWNARMGGFVPETTKDATFVATLSYPVPVSWNHDDYAKVQKAYYDATAKLTEIYRRAFRATNEARRAKLKHEEIAWIEQKRRICGHQVEALAPGGLAVAECLIAMTNDRRIFIKDEYILTEASTSTKLDQNHPKVGPTAADVSTHADVLNKCRNPDLIMLNELKFAKLIAKTKGWVVTGISSTPDNKLSSYDPSGSGGATLRCGFQDDYIYDKNPLSININEKYRSSSYNQMIIPLHSSGAVVVRFIRPTAWSRIRDFLHKLLDN